MGEIRIGTSGYSFPDWVGIAYPPGTRASDFLKHYVRWFDAVEINTTYYRIPRARFFERMRQSVPDRFLFAVKAPKELTHERERADDAIGPFREAIRPIAEAGQLGGVLLQFPFSFRPGPVAEGHLARLTDRLRDLCPLNVEFRHAAWSDRTTGERLRQLGLGSVSVDLPDLPNLPRPDEEPTSDIAYVRLHGRNRGAWWNPEAPGLRYNYLYSEPELDEWAGRIKRIAERSRQAFVFTNNCHLGQSVINALQLLERFRLPSPERSSSELFPRSRRDEIAWMISRLRGVG